MKKLLFLFLICPFALMGQQLLQAEYFFDKDPGYGEGIKLSFNPVESVNLSANLYIGSVAPGLHTLYYRFKDDQHDWGHTFNTPVLVGAQKAQLQQAEYFFDTDPGFGKGISMNFADAEDINLSANLYIELLKPGLHTLYYRFKDELNHWGQTFNSNVFVGEQKAKVQEAEYFFDTDPGYGKGARMNFEDTMHVVLSANLFFDPLPTGLHTFYYRFKSSKGWGTTHSQKVFKPSSSKINTLVYWFDDEGEHKTIHINPEIYTLNFEENISIESLEDGNHTIHLYVENVDGLRSDTIVSNVFKGPDGISDNQANNMPSFYPNPASEWIEFSHTLPQGEIHLFSIKGELVRTIQAAKKINVSEMPNGPYLISYQYHGQYRISILIIAH